MPCMPSPIQNPFVLHACELLGGVGVCTARRMFGGWGLSVDGMNIGLIVAETLYLKTHPATLPQWLAAGAQPFVYEARGRRVSVNYHTPPAEALESPALMLPWARLTLQAGLAARQPVRPARKAPQPPKARRRSA